ncbi:conserved Plasmodium protein, unknown function [Plasmodium ovale]|uniref:Uncharacterized protein n=2 Tax=Plasmodium ovale TaxID=36330 RepID=A0A1C3L4J2_PLAOA|nr:conserved Plasmodium protein, unknown function [Plasmodium ovale]
MKWRQLVHMWPSGLTRMGVAFPTIRFFATVQLYKPSKFRDIGRKLYLRKRLFKMLTMKPGNISQAENGKTNGKKVQKVQVEEDIFSNAIATYGTKRTRIYKNNKYNICEKGGNMEDLGGQSSIENILFKCSTFGYIELQHILCAFINYDRNALRVEDIHTLSSFLNLSEKEIYNYLCANEMIPHHFLETEIIKRLLKFVNINHPSLR